MPSEPADEREALARILTPAPPLQKAAAKRMNVLARAVPPAADLVLVGDSLAAGWPPDLLAEAAPGLRVFNFGLPGDRIQNTLWRLREGGMAHLRPQHTLILLGTNNSGDGDPPHAMLLGLEKLIDTVRRLWNGPEVHVVTVPWRDSAAHEAARLRLNAALRRSLAGLGWAHAVDADQVLGTGTQALPHLEADRLHLSRAGYDRLGAALRTRLKLGS